MQPAARGNEALQQGVPALHAPLGAAAAAEAAVAAAQATKAVKAAARKAAQAAKAAKAAARKATQAAKALRTRKCGFSDLPATDAVALLRLQHPNAGSPTVLVSPGVDVVWHPAAIGLAIGVVPVTFLKTVLGHSVTGQAMSTLAVDGAAQVDALMEKGASPASCMLISTTRAQ